nr:immunoglobulin heavy chain junction region [Mus musculus]MBK4184795.1 immunoglobulin heavy chain junction region [Mus musculus]
CARWGDYGVSWFAYW